MNESGTESMQHRGFTLRTLLNNHLLDRSNALSVTISKLAAVLGGTVLIAMVVHVLVEIILRAAFATSTFVLEEFLGYGVAAVTCLSLGYALASGALIRVSFVLNWLDLSARRYLEIFATLIALSCTAFLSWYIYFKMMRNFTRGTVSATIAQVPAWIPEAIVLTGFLVLALQLFARLLIVLLSDRDQLSDYFAETQVDIQDELG